jgi:hypothetical protein
MTEPGACYLNPPEPPEAAMNTTGDGSSTLTSFTSAEDLASAMRRAAEAHHEHEKRTGEADADWPAWYARYIVAEQAGTELPL